MTVIATKTGGRHRPTKAGLATKLFEYPEADKTQNRLNGRRVPLTDLLGSIRDKYSSGGCRQAIRQSNNNAYTNAETIAPMPAKSCGHLSVPMAEPVIGSSSSGGTPVRFRLTRVMRVTRVVQYMINASKV